MGSNASTRQRPQVDERWTDAEKEHLRALVVKYTVNVKVQWAKIGPLLPSGRSLNGARCTWGRMCKAEAKGAHA